MTKRMALPVALAPLRNPAFRLLWATWLAANVCMWMNEMACAWLMTTLTTSTTLIALVQTAATLPVFTLSMPSGVVADLVDRRRILMATQLWTSAVALSMSALLWSGAMRPDLLLIMVVASGASLAMRGPAYVSSVPEVLPKHEWQNAFALGGIAGHGARLIGPVGAGVLIAAGGVGAVFAFNAATAALISVVLWRTRSLQVHVQAAARIQGAGALPREPFVTAMRVGLQYVSQTARLKALLARVLGFYLATVALLALLPAMVKQQWHGTATTYTSMFALVGAGALLSVMVMPALKSRWDERRLLVFSILAYSAALAWLSFAANPWHAAPALVVAGMAWMVAGNQFTSSVQVALPSWVRARGMSIYHTALMGGNAGGALIWGRVADAAGMRASLFCASVATFALLWLVHATDDAVRQQEDVTADAYRPLAVDGVGRKSRVVTTVEYRVRPADHAAFESLMHATRRSRLRAGATNWQLLRDSADESIFVEMFSDVSLAEMQRRMQRAVAHDTALRDRRHALHIGPGKPLVRVLTRAADRIP